MPDMARKCHPIGIQSSHFSVVAWPLPHQTSSGSPGAPASSRPRLAACSRSRQLVNSMLQVSRSVSGVISMTASYAHRLQPRSSAAPISRRISGWAR